MEFCVSPFKILLALFGGFTFPTISGDVVAFPKMILTSLSHSSVDWGPVIFATLVPMAIIILGGVSHVLVRQGKTEQRVKSLEDNVRYFRDDVRDIRDDVQYLTRRATGSEPPSITKHIMDH